MRKILMFMLMVCATIMLSQPGQAQQLIESYQALLSERDHFNSNGQRLTTAAAIIRQDRANFHRFGLRDSADENDDFFADVNNRAALESLIARGSSQPRAISRIVNGTPLVRVNIFRGSRGNYINVLVLD